MKFSKLTFGEAKMEATPGKRGEIFAGNLADERHGGPVTVGYGRWGCKLDPGAGHGSRRYHDRAIGAAVSFQRF